MTQTTITQEDILAILPLLDGSRINPVDSPGLGCAYTNPKDLNDHCIAGEILVRLGRADLLPDPIDAQNHEWGIGGLIREAVRAGQLDIAPNAINLLQNLQEIADHMTSEGNGTWSDAIKKSLESLGLSEVS